MSTTVSREDLEVLDMLAGEAGYDCVGFEGGNTLFAPSEFGRRGRRKRRARRMRKARRKGFDSLKAFRRGRRKKIAGGVKKVANNKIVRGVSKAILSVVPGGQVVVAATTAARMAAKVVKAAKRGNAPAKAAVALGEAAKRGDSKALNTLKEAATGRHSNIPIPKNLDVGGMLSSGIGSLFGADETAVVQLRGQTFRFPVSSL